VLGRGAAAGSQKRKRKKGVQGRGPHMVRMLCRRSASLTSTTRGSLIIPISIRRRLSTCTPEQDTREGISTVNASHSGHMSCVNSTVPCQKVAWQHCFQVRSSYGRCV